MKKELYYDEVVANTFIVQIKQEMFKMLKNGRSGHIGSSLSCVEILMILHWIKYIEKQSVHLIFSKGHAELAIYATMKSFGIISDGKLKEYGSRLQGHPSKRWIPEIEYSSGSLGQGLSYGIGVAMVNRKDKVFVVLGDGEMQEGQVWEALIVAIRLKLNNLCIIIDFNGMQLQERCLFPNNKYKLQFILEKLGYKVKICNGHNNIELYNEFHQNYDNSCIIIAETVKGHGILRMENNADYHSKVLTQQEIQEILCEISKEEIKRRKRICD